MSVEDAAVTGLAGTFGIDNLDAAYGSGLGFRRKLFGIYGDERVGKVIAFPVTVQIGIPDCRCVERSGMLGVSAGRCLCKTSLDDGSLWNCHGDSLVGAFHETIGVSLLEAFYNSFQVIDPHGIFP